MDIKLFLKVKVSGVYDTQCVLLMKVKRSINRLYKLIIYSAEDKCLMVNCESESWLWHSRLYHVNFRAMEFMSTTNMVYGMQNISKPTRSVLGA